MPFYLKSPANKTTGEKLIYLQINLDNKRIKQSTNLTIDPTNWDSKLQRPKRTFKFFKQFAAILERHEGTYFDLYLNAKAKAPENLTATTLKNQLVKELAPQRIMTVADYADDYIKHKKGVAASTISQFNIVARNLRAFNPELTFAQIDLEVMSAFKEFLLHKGGEKKTGYEQNSVHFLFKKFKTILNHASETGVNTNFRYKSRNKEAQVGEVLTTEIFLDEKELMLLWNLKGLSTALESVRDAFLVSCYTGTRYSDISKINARNFNSEGKNKFFRVIPKKTVDEVVDIPVHPLVLEIMEKWNWHIPIVSNPKFNKHIKDVGKIAGIDRDFFKPKLRVI